MHKLVGITMTAFIVPFSVEAVKFESVLVRQQWPWNAKVNIDYVLTEADGKMWDVSVAFRAGGETLDVPSASLSGDRYSVSAGQRRIVWDPLLTSYTNRSVLADLEITLSAESVDEKRYLIIDMTEGAVNGKAAAIWPVSYTNEVVDADGDGKWDREFKTTKMVFRRIEAGTFTMGIPATEYGTYGKAPVPERQHQVVISRPFYMGVFPLTAKQFRQVRAYWGNTTYGKSEETGARPANGGGVTYNALRGSVGDGINWPTTMHAVLDDPSVEVFDKTNGSAANNMSFLAWFRRHVPGLVVDLPTEAQWEYCCRAGTSPHSFYNGVNIDSSEYQASVTLPAPGIESIARTKNNSQVYDADTGKWSTPEADGTEYGPCDVGSYDPNDWGLYDMHGNVNELCLDWFNNATLSDETDPKGPYESPESTARRVYRGGGFSNWPSDSRAGFRGACDPGLGYANFGCRLAIHLD